MDKFMRLLTVAGTMATDQTPARHNLLTLQNAIVDPRFAAADFRDFQNRVGETLPNSNNIVHYICPSAAMVNPLMSGIAATAKKTSGIDAVVRASIIAFGFVFIHLLKTVTGAFTVF